MKPWRPPTKGGWSDVDLDLAKRLYAEQKGLCAVCGLARRLFIDHCHESGQVRGLLCVQCNTGLGMLGDAAERLDAAAAYLRRPAPQSLDEVKQRRGWGPMMPGPEGPFEEVIRATSAHFETID